jgi:N,N'-diacetyllegionaminate synthase
MSEATHTAVVQRCKERGVEFMSTGFDEEAVDFLLTLGIRRIKVPSGEITNLPFLSHMARQGLPLIISTGMATLDEISEAVEVVRNTRAQAGRTEPLESVVTILHCTSNYPAALQDVNLRAMQTISAATGLPVGYSDHTAGTTVSVAAVALGATVIEKHFTLDRSLPGPDHKASLEPQELLDMVRRIREVEQALGSSVKAPNAAELPVRALVRRSVTLVRAVNAGEVISAADLTLMRPGDGIAPKHLAELAGRRAAHPLEAGTTLQWSDLH